ncbi:MAG: hypothetical protein JKY65_20870 [Planctomycetes bacterium]|nr:hypothetical protein [Planctomycetota bacterium]
MRILAFLLLGSLAGCASPTPVQSLPEQPPEAAVRLAREIAARLPRSLEEWEARGKPSFRRDGVFWAEHAMTPALDEPRVQDVRIGSPNDPRYCGLYHQGPPRCEDHARCVPCSKVPFGSQQTTACKLSDWLRATHSGLDLSGLRGRPAFVAPDPLGGGAALNLQGVWLVRIDTPSGLPVCVWWGPPPHMSCASRRSFSSGLLERVRADQIARWVASPEFDAAGARQRFPLNTRVEVSVQRLRRTREGWGWRHASSAWFSLGSAPEPSVFFGGGAQLWKGSHRVGDWVVHVADWARSTDWLAWTRIALSEDEHLFVWLQVGPSFGSKRVSDTGERVRPGWSDQAEPEEVETPR